MRRTLFTIACLSTLSFLGVQAFEPVMDEGVIVLSSGDFDEAVAYYDNLLVEFYAPWCGHCKKLAPEYVKAAAELAKLDPPQYVAKVDATENKDLQSRFEVKGFPTLKFFVSGTPTEYTGGRSAETITQWIKKKTGPPSELLDGPSAVAKIASMQKTIVYIGAEGTDAYKAHQAVAKDSNMNNLWEFVNTTDETVAASFGMTAGGIVVVRNFDTQFSPYTGGATAAEITAFAATLQTPVLINFDDNAIEPIFGKKNAALILFSNEKDQAYQTVFADAATSLKGKILFVKSTTNEGIQTKLAEYVGVTAKDTPCLRIVQLGEDLAKYNYTGGATTDITAESLDTFISDFKAGNLTPFQKSEPVPETNDEPVKVIVGTEWQSIVGDTTKDVFVEYYAPWCGHCKSLAPIWTELGQYVEGLDDLVIAKMDATLNEAKGVAVKSFPTLIYYPKNNKKGVAYSAGRTLDEFKTYLSENSASYKAKFTTTTAGATTTDPVQEEL